MSPESGTNWEQRREHVRVPVDMTCPLMVPATGTVEARIIDISGGGCAIVTPFRLNEGKHCFLEIPFEAWTFEVEVAVRFSRNVPAGWLSGVMFFDIGKTLTEKIVREVFALQRYQLKNRK